MMASFNKVGFSLKKRIALVKGKKQREIIKKIRYRPNKISVEENLLAKAGARKVKDQRKPAENPKRSPKLSRFIEPQFKLSTTVLQGMS